MLDMVAHRHQLREVLIRLVELLTNRPPSGDLIDLKKSNLDIPLPVELEKRADPDGPGSTP